MEFSTYSELLKSKLWAILIGAALTSLACYYVATTYTNWPRFEARATLLIEESDTNTPIQNRESLKIAQRTISELAIRAPLTEHVVDKIGLDISAKELAKLIRIRTPENTWIIEAIGVHKDPLIAAAIANAVVEEIESISAFDLKTKLISPAKIPQQPLFSSYLLVLIAAVLGAIVVSGLLCLGELRNDTVRHERDIRQNLDIPILGMITAAKKSNGELSHAAQQSYQWLFAQIFVTNNSRPSTLLITSPQESALQSTFVHKFVNQNLRGELQATNSQNLLTSTISEEDIWQPQAPALPLGIEPGPFYDLEVDESPLGTQDSEVKTFRHIHIVDAPPVLSNANTMMLAQRFDSVLLVIEAKKTKIRDIKQAIQLLQNSGTPIIGSVLLA